MKDLVKATGLWTGKDKNGNPTLSGNLGGARVLIFKNNYKEEEKHPDYIMYFGQNEKKKDEPNDPFEGEDFAGRNEPEPF